MLASYETYVQMESSSLTFFAASLYTIGLTGMLFNYKNYLVTMMCVELMYLGVITAFILHAGAVYALLLLILAACESAIGLGLLILLYRFGRSIDFASYESLRG